MLKFLTFRAFSRFDAVWLMIFVLAWRDGHYFAAVAVAIVCGMVSGAMEAIEKRTSEQAGGLNE